MMKRAEIELNRRAALFVYLLMISAVLACSRGAEERSSPLVAASDALLSDPGQAFPQKLSATGLFPRAPDLSVTPANALHYAPLYPLWSNGTLKARHVVLPAGQRVDNRDRERWRYPVGTLFFKTFFYDEPKAQGGVRPIETRVLRRTKKGWDYALYEWDAKGEDALSQDLRFERPVEFTNSEGVTIRHALPDRASCRKCHEADLEVVLGFNELQLNAARPDGLVAKVGVGTSQTQLRALASSFEQPPPDDAAQIVDEDPEQRWVKGYMMGNCEHCHNEQLGAVSPFDLGHDVFLQNTINQPAERWPMSGGARIVPGHPEESVLFLAFSGEDVRHRGIEAMPPEGISVRDAAAVERMRQWILSLPER